MLIRLDRHGGRINEEEIFIIICGYGYDAGGDCPVT